MTPEQFEQIRKLLETVALNMSHTGKYTITGAADWPILLVIGGLLTTAIGLMWADLRANIKEGKSEWRAALEQHKADNEKNFDLVWQAHRDCQHECCPRRKE